MKEVDDEVALGTLSPGSAARPSVAALLSLQHPAGAFVASPDFGQYQYCWLRDASFIAYALDRAGETDASHRFHRWAASAVSGVAELMTGAISRHKAGLALDPLLMPPARFDLDGTVVDDDWPNFQVDGYGTWLWALQCHLATVGERALPSELAPAVESTARYLATVGRSPCYDVWEESGHAVHTSTLACVYAGLQAASTLLGEGSYATLAEDLRLSLWGSADQYGYYVKSDHSNEVDGALLWLCRPFGVAGPHDAPFVETVRRISGQLDLDGGTRRYPGDVYYGSGAWPVLTASLGWYHVAAGDLAAAQARLDWVAARVDDQGRLAEQFGGDGRDPEHYHEWAQRWGPPAADLLWSHAMYVVLAAEVEAAQAHTSPPTTGGPTGSAPAHQP